MTNTFYNTLSDIITLTSGIYDKLQQNVSSMIQII
jgi:hypothetical protein